MKTAWITGASRGIGAAMARAFAEAGYAVALNYRQSEEKARRLAEELTRQGGVAACYRADVADPHQAEEMVRRCEEELGQITVLINNAGISADGLFTDLTDEVWHRLWEVNVSGTLYCSRAVLPAMIRRGSGVILTLSSMWGQVGASCEVAYSATKAAVIGFTRALAQEVGPAGIRVNCLAPGVIDTDMNQVYGKEALDALAQETPLQRIGRPEEVAQLALWLASEKAGFITGQVIGINGGFC